MHVDAARRETTLPGHHGTRGLRISRVLMRMKAKEPTKPSRTRNSHWRSCVDQLVVPEVGDEDRRGSARLIPAAGHQLGDRHEAHSPRRASASACPRSPRPSAMRSAVGLVLAAVVHQDHVARGRPSRLRPIESSGRGAAPVLAGDRPGHRHVALGAHRPQRSRAGGGRTAAASASPRRPRRSRCPTPRPRPGSGSARRGSAPRSAATSSGGCRCGCRSRGRPRAARAAAPARARPTCRSRRRSRARRGAARISISRGV